MHNKLQLAKVNALVSSGIPVYAHMIQNGKLYKIPVARVESKGWSIEILAIGGRTFSLAPPVTFSFAFGKQG